MERLKRFGVLVLCFTVLIVCPSKNYSQRLYDKIRDEQAQQALELAEPLKNGSIFETQLKNLANRTKIDFETEFLVRKFEINSQSLSTIKWGDAHEYVCSIQINNTNIHQIPTSDEIKTAVDDVKNAVASTKQSLNEFECEIKTGNYDSRTDTCNNPKEEDDPTLTSLFDRLGNLQSIIDFSQKLNEELPGEIKFKPKTLSALGKIKDTIEQLQGVYKEYTKNVKAYNQLAIELGDMRLTLKKVALQSLQVDEEHLKNVAAIRARLETEQGDVFSLIRNYKYIVMRLNLLPDFDPEEILSETPEQSAKNFCTLRDELINNGRDSQVLTNENLMIVEYLKEVVQHSKRLEKDNQDVLSKAKLALLKLNKNATILDLNGSIQATIASLNTARNNINSNEVIHQNEKNREVNLAEISAKLADNSQDRKQVLQKIIDFSYQSTVDNRDMVADIPQALYTLAALISRGDTPRRLAELRLSTEYQAYSIRKSAVRVRAYELTISTGAKRLALFHKGGIKPETIAELVFAISNVAIPPTILAK